MVKLDEFPEYEENAYDLEKIIVVPKISNEKLTRLLMSHLIDNIENELDELYELTEVPEPTCEDDWIEEESLLHDQSILNKRFDKIISLVHAIKRVILWKEKLGEGDET